MPEAVTDSRIYKLTTGLYTLAQTRLLSCKLK